jgi:hypothetical protein
VRIAGPVENEGAERGSHPHEKEPDRDERREPRDAHVSEEAGSAGRQATRRHADNDGITEGERHENRTWWVAGNAFAVRPFSKADLRRLAMSRRRMNRSSYFDGYPAVLIPSGPSQRRP